MLFYIDYLDHITSGTRAFELLRLRLRYDLLILDKILYVCLFQHV